MVFEYALEVLRDLVSLGGPVVALLIAMSVLSFTVVFWKFAVFAVLGLGRHRTLTLAIDAHDRGEVEFALELAAGSRSHLKAVFQKTLERSAVERSETFRTRVIAETATRLDTAARGLRVLDSISQVAPLLGLFGTVLGMINAFQGLQGAGSNVDPSVLAGGIWVALLTTAMGLGVAMPTSLLLTWLETRIENERAFADQMIARLFSPYRKRNVETFKRSITMRSHVPAQ
ncbi:MAG: MotA/TolQ/ExbB proton channel family protein [Pseudomonadota bacterium]